MSNRGRKRREGSPAEQDEPLSDARPNARPPDEPSTDARPNARPPVSHGDPNMCNEMQMVLATSAAPPAAGAGGQGEPPPHAGAGREAEGVDEGAPATGKGGGAGKGGAGKGKGEAGAGKGKGAEFGGKGKGGAGKGGAGKGAGAGKGCAGKGGTGKGTSGGKGRGGWVEARVNITAGSRNKYIGGAVTKINYLKVTLLQTDNPLVRHRNFEPSPHPLCTDPTLTLTPQMKQAASEVLHDLHVSVWLSDHYELTLGKEGAGIWTRASAQHFIDVLLKYCPASAVILTETQAIDLSFFDTQEAETIPSCCIAKTNSLAVRPATPSCAPSNSIPLIM